MSTVKKELFKMIQSLEVMSVNIGDLFLYNTSMEDKWLVISSNRLKVHIHTFIAFVSNIHQKHSNELLTYHSNNLKLEKSTFNQ